METVLFPDGDPPVLPEETDAGTEACAAKAPAPELPVL